MNKFTSLILFAGFASGLTSCDKDDPKMVDPAAGRLVAEQTLLANAVFATAFANVEANAKQKDGLVDALEVYGELDGGFGTETTERGRRIQPWNCRPGIRYETHRETVWPAILSLKYGTAGCQGADGRVLTGKLTATFDGRINLEGSTIEIDFDEFGVDGYLIDGQYRVEALGIDADNLPTFRHTVSDATFVTPDSLTFSYEAVTDTRLARGGKTNFFTHGLAGITDDVWEETRSATLVSAEGTYKLTTTQPAWHPITCSYPTSGGYVVSGGALEGEVELLYGTGECDDAATVIYGGAEYEIDLR